MGILKRRLCLVNYKNFTVLALATIEKEKRFMPLHLQDVFVEEREGTGGIGIQDEEKEAASMISVYVHHFHKIMHSGMP